MTAPRSLRPRRPVPDPRPRRNRPRGRRLRRFLRAAGLGIVSGLAAAVALAYAFTGSIGPPPAAERMPPGRDGGARHHPTPR